MHRVAEDVLSQVLADVMNVSQTPIRTSSELAFAKLIGDMAIILTHSATNTKESVGPRVKDATVQQVMIVHHVRSTLL